MQLKQNFVLLILLELKVFCQKQWWIVEKIGFLRFIFSDLNSQFFTHRPSSTASMASKMNGPKIYLFSFSLVNVAEALGDNVKLFATHSSTNSTFRIYFVGSGYWIHYVCVWKYHIWGKYLIKKFSTWTCKNILFIRFYYVLTTSPVIIIIWRKFLTEPFLQKFHFLFYKILN